MRIPPTSHPPQDPSPASATLSLGVPRIVLASDAYYSDVHAGVVTYVCQRNWTLDATMVVYPGSMPRADDCNGILATVCRSPLLEWIVERRCPVVHLLHSHLRLPQWPSVLCDWEAVGRLGAQHFLELGNVHFAFYRFFDSPDITGCLNGFTREIEAHGHRVHQIDYGRSPDRELKRLTSRGERVRWCMEKLSSLPRPLAVMAGDDNFAVDLVLAARELGWSIPEDIAILGTEDQPLIRGIVAEEISSVDVNLHEVGRLGAELLGRLIEGALPDSSDVPMLVKVQPKGLKARHSTSTFSCDHPGVTAAVRFIRNHFHEDISVANVAAQIGMSVRSLYTEYSRRLGRTVKEEILRERLKRAQSLLEHTDLKLAAIAAESGFGTAENLCHVFQRTYHVTPQAWRLQRRQ